MKIVQKSFWLFWGILLVLGGEAFGGQEQEKIPWNLLPRVAQLEEKQRMALFDVLKGERNYGGSKQSVYDCLIMEKPDRAAIRMANFGAYLVSKGMPPRNLGLLIYERAKFADPLQVNTFTYEETPLKGSPEAKITITEFAEFKCPYCVTLGPLLEKLVKESGGQVRLFFKHFPLKSHHGSPLSSKAAQAANRQGKFWEMYERLFKDMNKQSMEDLLNYAGELGLDMEKFKNDLEDPELLRVIERDVMEGVRANVTGTPTLFINGKFYNFRNDEEFLKDTINDEAERLGVAPPYSEWRYE